MPPEAPPDPAELSAPVCVAPVPPTAPPDPAVVAPVRLLRWDMVRECETWCSRASAGVPTLPGRLLRQAEAPLHVESWPGVDGRDPRLSTVLRADAELLQLYQFTLHGDGTIWDGANDRLLWSDVPNRRLLAWYPDGRVETAIDATVFMNGNAIGPDGVPVHCEHGRRCISRSSGDGSDGGAVPIVGHRSRRMIALGNLI